MEISFENESISCLDQVVSQVQKLEETQEIRLKEDMPDIGRILAAWGQPVLRGKEWNTGKIGVSYGVIVRILYAAEGSDEIRCVEDWIPFQMKCDFSDSGKEGNIRADCILRSVDARLISSRKMIIRALMDISCEAVVRNELKISIPGEIPDELQLLKKKMDVMIRREAGEKVFVIDETITPPASHPQLKEIVRYQLQTEVIDRKVVSDKLVFRGSCVIHLAYIADDGQLHMFDIDVPFSQYTELEDVYSDGADAVLSVAVTNIDLKIDETGMIRLNAGFAGQYIIQEAVSLQFAVDAYSICGTADPTMESLSVTEITELCSRSIKIGADSEIDCRRIADASMYYGYPSQEITAGRNCFSVEGIVQILYYDSDGQLQSHTDQAKGQVLLDLDVGQNCKAYIRQSGKLQSSISSNGVEIAGGMDIIVMSETRTGLEMISDIKLDATGDTNSMGPSLILRKSNGENLWTIAKNTGSTVERICQINALNGEPEPTQMLMIPIAQ